MNQHDQIKMWEKNSGPSSFGFGNDGDKIPAKAFLSCSQSSIAKGTDWGIVTVGIVCEYAVYEGKERDRGVVTLMAFISKFLDNWHGILSLPPMN